MAQWKGENLIPCVSNCCFTLEKMIVPGLEQAIKVVPHNLQVVAVVLQTWQKVGILEISSE